MSSSHPEKLTFELSINDDAQLDCFFCRLGGRNGRPCDLMLTAFGQGRVVGIGVHRACVDWHNMRLIRKQKRVLGSPELSREERGVSHTSAESPCSCGARPLAAGERGVTDDSATHTREKCTPYTWPKR